MSKFSKQELDRVSQADEHVQALVNRGLIVNSDGQLTVNWKSGDLISKRKMLKELSEALSELHSSLSPEIADASLAGVCSCCPDALEQFTQTQAELQAFASERE